MELRIGVTDTNKELMIDLEEGTDRDGLVSGIEKALDDESQRMLWFTDKRGRSVGVPTARVAYVELAAEDQRRVGFGVS